MNTTDMKITYRFSWPWQGRPARCGVSGPMFAVLLLPMMLLVGLVVDGGRVLVAQRRAQGAVDAAALGAAMGIDEPAFKQTDHIRLDANSANSMADLYRQLNTGSSSGIANLTIHCTVGGAGQTHVDCVGSLSVSTIFMRLGGIPAVHLTLTAGSDLQTGITRAGQ